MKLRYIIPYIPLIGVLYIVIIFFFFHKFSRFWAKHDYVEYIWGNETSYNASSWVNSILTVLIIWYLILHGHN